MYQKLVPMLLVDDVDRAVEWLKDVFGVGLQASLPENPSFEWVSLKLGDVEIMFSEKDQPKIGILTGSLPRRN